MAILLEAFVAGAMGMGSVAKAMAADKAYVGRAEALAAIDRLKRIVLGGWVPMLATISESDRQAVLAYRGDEVAGVPGSHDQDYE